MSELRKYFESLNTSVFPEKVSNYLKTEILTDDDIDLLDESDEDFLDVKSLIEEMYPQATVTQQTPLKQSYQEWESELSNMIGKTLGVTREKALEMIQSDSSAVGNAWNKDLSPSETFSLIFEQLDPVIEPIIEPVVEQPIVEPKVIQEPYLAWIEAIDSWNMLLEDRDDFPAEDVEAWEDGIESYKELLAEEGIEFIDGKYQYVKTFSEGGKSISQRIQSMIEGWKEEGRAFSVLQNDDSDFFKAIGIPYDKLGITSQTGNDIVYYDTKIYDSDTDALRKRRKKAFAEGGIVDLFEDYENIPEKVQKILDKYSDEFGGDGSDMDYKDTANMLKEIEAEGYTFGYGLDNEPYGLRPVGVKLNELRGYEDFDEDEYAEGGGASDDLLSFTIPTWALSALVNSDESGMEDEDIEKLNKFTDEIALEYGNANFMMGNEEEMQSHFTYRNDIDGNLGADVVTMYLRPSNKYAKGGGIYEVQKIGQEDKPLSESMMSAKNLTELKNKVKDKYGTTEGFRVTKRSKSGAFHNVLFQEGGGAGSVTKEEYNNLLSEYDRLTEMYMDFDDDYPEGKVDKVKKAELQKKIQDTESKIHSYEREYKNGGGVGEYKYKLGDKYRSDFDYEGMLQAGLKSDVSWGIKKLTKLYNSFVDVNYHSQARLLWDAVELLKEDKKDLAEFKIAELHQSIEQEIKEIDGNYAKGGSIESDIKDLQNKLESAEKRYRKAIQEEQVGIISSTELDKYKENVSKARGKVNDWYASRPITSNSNAKLKAGGSVNYLKKWNVTYITFQGKKGTKEITLGRQSDTSDVKNALKRMGESQDLNIREVISIKEVKENGGGVSAKIKLNRHNSHGKKVQIINENDEHGFYGEIGTIKGFVEPKFYVVEFEDNDSEYTYLEEELGIPENTDGIELSATDRARLDVLQAKEDLDNLTKSENEEYESLVKKYRKSIEYKGGSAYGNGGGVGEWRKGTSIRYKTRKEAQVRLNLLKSNPNEYRNLSIEKINYGDKFSDGYDVKFEYLKKENKYDNGGGVERSLKKQKGQGYITGDFFEDIKKSLINKFGDKIWRFDEELEYGRRTGRLFVFTKDASGYNQIAKYLEDEFGITSKIDTIFSGGYRGLAIQGNDYFYHGGGVDDMETFFNESKNTQGGNSFKEYDAKYSSYKYQAPHVQDALKKAKTFSEFQKLMSRFDNGSTLANGGDTDNPHKFTYMMLSRLQSDNDYFLKAGGGHEKHLWANDVNAQIAEMKRLWKSLPKDAKPEWLSMEEIQEYEQKMKNYNSGSTHLADGGNTDETNTFLSYHSNIPDANKNLVKLRKEGYKCEIKTLGRGHHEIHEIID